MKNVYLDGEEVLFDGPLPSDMPALQAVLNQHLHKNGRVLTRWLVDGVDTLSNTDAVPPSMASKVEAFSEAHSDLLNRLTRNISQEGPAILNLLDEFGHKILSHPWSTQSASLGALIEKLIPIIELLGHLNEYAQTHNLAWQQTTATSIESFGSIFEKLTSIAQAQDIALLSELVLLNLAPLVSQTLHSLQSTVSPTLTP